MEKGIKILSAKLRNFGKFSKFEVKFPDGVSYLCANNGGGKSTLSLNGIWQTIKGIAETVSKGQFPGKRIKYIGNAGASADRSYTFIDERTDRTFKWSNHITKQTNSIKIQPGDDGPIPEEWLSDFFNINLMSSKHFCSLSGMEQAKALGIDTSVFDKNIADKKEERKLLNRDIKEIGAFVVVDKVRPVDLSALLSQRKDLSNELNLQYISNRDMNTLNKSNYEKDVKNYNDRKVQYLDLYDNLKIFQALGYKGSDLEVFIDGLVKSNIKPEEPEYPEEMPDRKELDELDKQISEAEETNKKATAYKEYTEKSKKLGIKEREVEQIQADIDAEEEVKLNYINQTDFGFAGLKTNESGELEFNGRPIREPYFSTGECIMIVAKLMRSQNPVFKTVFLDTFTELDPPNAKKILEELTDEGFQVIISIPNEDTADKENCIVLRECKLLTDSENEGDELL